ncbi:MAG: hypothetical protein CL506_01485 [Actinobacteria bacterium]|nr:hypothetical protein [Actinomycetota bacterium]
MFVDIHTHIAQYNESEISGIVSRWRSSKVEKVVSCGTTIKDSLRSIELAKQHKDVVAGIGLHPSDLSKKWRNDLNSLEKLIDDNVVMISEIGLDYLPESPPKPIQVKAFENQIDIAIRNQLPIVFHMRESIKEVLAILKYFRDQLVGGAAHYFDGTFEDAKRIVDLGFNISFSKTLIREEHLKEVARKLPLDKIVIETDSYPQYFKKNRNRWTEPKDVVLVASELSRIKKVDIEEIAWLTKENSEKFIK